MTPEIQGSSLETFCRVGKKPDRYIKRFESVQGHTGKYPVSVNRNSEVEPPLGAGGLKKAFGKKGDLI